MTVVDAEKKECLFFRVHKVRMLNFAGRATTTTPKLLKSGKNASEKKPSTTLMLQQQCTRPQNFSCFPVNSKPHAILLDFAVISPIYQGH